MLQGAMPNVNIQVNTGSPGAGGTISIRGMGSVNSSSPLILVDGIPGSIDQLNPNDIESISVLKDASSAAIYGARAAFGVVLVTTKKAKSGSRHERLPLPDTDDKKQHCGVAVPVPLLL